MKMNVSIFVQQTYRFNRSQFGQLIWLCALISSFCIRVWLTQMILKINSFDLCSRIQFSLPFGCHVFMPKSRLKMRLYLGQQTFSRIILNFQLDLFVDPL